MRTPLEPVSGSMAAVVIIGLDGELFSTRVIL